MHKTSLPRRALGRKNGRGPAGAGPTCPTCPVCELLALNSNVPVAATFSFAGLSARGGLTGDHVDGWGLGFHGGEACQVFVDTGRACDAPLAGFLQQHPPRATTVLAHVRKATQGAVALSNCHPFQRTWRGRHWLFCHNGDLKDYAPRLDGAFLPVGATDSERAFCWLLQELDRTVPGADLRGTTDDPDFVDALAGLVPRISRHGAFNFLLTDGHVVVAHCSTRMSWLLRRHPFGSARLLDRDLEIDLDRFNRPGDRMAVVATAPLTQHEPWQLMAPGELRVFGQGRLLAARNLAAPRRQPGTFAVLEVAGP
jgi:predicted glutamine amidotransferase